MTARTGALIGCGLAVAVSGAASPAVAQVSGTADVAFSHVRYDGFLGSGAVAITPTFEWVPPGGRGIVRARGTYLRFESGRHSLDAELRGAVLAELGPRWRGEIGATAGASRYADIASFSHGVLEARLHYMGEARGSWLGASAGRASLGSSARPVLVAAAGAWWLRPPVTLHLWLDRTVVGDTSYSDARLSARWQRGPLLLDGRLGTRFWSRGGGRGVYAEATVRFDLRRHLALVVGGGRYATDVTSGSIAGRYLTFGIRLGNLRRLPATRTHVTPTPHLHASPGSVSLDVAAAPTGVRLVIHAPGAGRVEIAGDFSDWEPLPLIPDGSGAWNGVLALASGVHRIAVRVDGGAWVAPHGTTRIPDDYGGEVGLLVVP